MHARCIVKTSGFTRGVCKNQGFYYISRFSCGTPREQAILRKSKTPENCQKSGLFWASPFTMHLVCTLLTDPTNKRVSFRRPLQILADIRRAKSQPVFLSIFTGFFLGLWPLKLSKLPEIA